MSVAALDAGYRAHRETLVDLKSEVRHMQIPQTIPEMETRVLPESEAEVYLGRLARSIGATALAKTHFDKALDLEPGYYVVDASPMREPLENLVGSSYETQIRNESTVHIRSGRERQLIIPARGG